MNSGKNSLLYTLLFNMQKYYKIIALLLLIAGSGQVFGQKMAVEVLTTGTKTSLRGLSVVNDNVLWVSGSQGKVGRSTNGGKNWKWMTVPGFEKAEFRDIEAFGPNTAIIMASGDSAYILKTIDGGDNWRIVYQNFTKGMFLDAMDFYTPEHGIVVGDPVNNRFFIAETKNNGDSWEQTNLQHPGAVADSGEAFYAASGTNVRLFPDGSFYLASGGKASRLITRTSATALPLVQNTPASGAYSIAVYKRSQKTKRTHIVIVGGDYTRDTSNIQNCIFSVNNGKTWQRPKTPPKGFRSCVEFITDEALIACGTSGVDLSYDAGRRWTNISGDSYNVCRAGKFSNVVFLAGNNGTIGKLVETSKMEN